MKLNKDDYIKIIKHYGQKVPTRKNSKKPNITKTKKMARSILARKLCKCIKKVQKTSNVKEPAAIAICNESIFSNRNLKHYRFTCKKRYHLKNKKNKRYSLTKTKKNINF